MRIACLYLPGFAIQVERRASPALCGRPLIIGGYYHEIGRVREVSREAAAYGIVKDMPLRHAYSLCPSGVFLPYQEERYTEACSVVLSQIAQLCPLVESVSLACVLMGLRYEREERRFVEDVMSAVQHTGFQVSCGIASSRFAACLAAEEADIRGVLVLAGKEEQAFLHELSVVRLPASDATVRRLHLFGITRVGDLLSLPPGTLEAQFGSEGQRLLELVRGVDVRDVERWEGVREIVQTRCFDVPVARGDELIEAVGETLASLCCQLRDRWQCCRSIAVLLRLESGAVRQETLHFKEPTASREVMDRRIASFIEHLAIVAPVEELQLTASGLCAEEGRQSSFLNGPCRSNSQFGEAVALLQQRYGRNVMKKVATRRGVRLSEEQFSFVSCKVEEQ